MARNGRASADLFAVAIAEVLRHEGEHAAADPSDPGGDTWFGISRRAFPALDPWPPTREQATMLYREHYWTPLRCDDLPPALAIAVFDGGVNQGRTLSAVLLQEILGVARDGLIGPATVAAARMADAGELLADFLARRASRYAFSPGFSRFGRGWMRRLFDVHRAALAFVQTSGSA